jgi:hypothetical protein
VAAGAGWDGEDEAADDAGVDGDDEAVALADAVVVAVVEEVVAEDADEEEEEEEDGAGLVRSADTPKSMRRTLPVESIIIWSGFECEELDHADKR